MTRARVLLADDHLLIAQALEHLLQSHFEVVGTVSDGRALLKAASELKPDVAVVDIGMPLLNGLDAGEQLKSVQPDIKVIILTQNREPRFAVEAFRRHASGYLLKDSAASELTTAICEALGGRSYVSPAIAKAMVDETLVAGGSVVTRELSGRELQGERDAVEAATDVDHGGLVTRENVGPPTSRSGPFDEELNRGRLGRCPLVGRKRRASR